MKKKLKQLVILFLGTLVIISLTGCILGNKMPLTKKEQNTVALRIYNNYKGVTEVKFTDYRIVGFTAPRLDVELNGNPEDSSVLGIDRDYLGSEFETKWMGLDPVEWNENTKSYWFRGKYEPYEEGDSLEEHNPDKIKITYLDGSTNR